MIKIKFISALASPFLLCVFLLIFPTNPASAIEFWRIDQKDKLDDSIPLNCIDKEKIETNGEAEFYGKVGMFGGDTEEELKKKAVSRCNFPAREKLIGEIAYNENDHMTASRWPDMGCIVSNIQEIPNTTSRGEAKFKYNYKASMMVEHQPSSKTSVREKMISIPGQRSEKGAIITSNIYLSKTEALSEEAKEKLVASLQKKCDGVGGTISSIEHKSYGTQREWRVEGPVYAAEGGATLYKWATDALCSGDFYLYDWPSNTIAAAEKKCTKEESDISVKDRKEVICEYNDRVKSALLTISKEAQQQVPVKVFDVFSFKKADSENLYNKWQCDRFASCQSKESSGMDPETLATYSKVCKFTASKPAQKKSGSGKTESGHADEDFEDTTASTK